MIGDGDEKSALVIQASQLLKAGKFEYARNREIKRELDKAITFFGRRAVSFPRNVFALQVDRYGARGISAGL